MLSCTHGGRAEQLEQVCWHLAFERGDRMSPLLAACSIAQAHIASVVRALRISQVGWLVFDRAVACAAGPLHQCRYRTVP